MSGEVLLVGKTGLEPTISSSQMTNLNQLGHFPINHNKYVLTFAYPQGEFTSCVVQQLPSSTQKTILSIMFVVILVGPPGYDPRIPDYESDVLTT